MTGAAARLFTPRRWQVLAALLDQAVVSAGNLAVGLLVLRISSKDDYGLYSLCYMTLILLNGVSGALFGAQMTVSYYQVAAADRVSFATSMLMGQAVLSGGACLLLLAAMAGLAGFGITAGPRDLLTIMVLAVPFAMAHDFFRTYFFMVGRAHSALLLDTLLVLLWGAATALAALRLEIAPHLAALASYGLAAACTSLTGLVLSRLSVHPGLRRIWQVTASSWKHGRWALSGVAVTAAQNQAHVYLLGWLGSPAAVADLNAARMLFTPMSLLTLGSTRTLVPRLAQLLADHKLAEMQRLSVRTIVALSSVVACYSVAILLSYRMIIGGLLPAKYAGIGPLVLLWGVVALLQAIDTILSAVLQVTKRFRYLTIINIWTAVPVVVAVVPMILSFGASGSLVTLAAGYAGMAMLLWRDFRRSLGVAQTGSAGA